MAILIILVLLVLVTLVYYHFFIKPKNLMAHYRKIFQPSFKVYQYPFDPFQAAQFTMFKKSEKNHGDCYHFLKQVTSQFDVSIANIADKVSLQLISPKLMRGFFQLDEQIYYRKYEMVIGGLRRMVGTGLTFSEGKQWKNKRRVVTKMLNFKYIKTLVPKMKVIVDKRIQQLLRQVTSKQPDQKIQINLLDLTTRIASTVILQLFFGGSQTANVDLSINGRQVSEHIRQLLIYIEQQLLDPFAIMFGKRYTELGLTTMYKKMNKLLKEFHSFTRQFVEKRITELQSKFSQLDHSTYNPEYYEDLIEAFYFEQIIKKNQLNKPIPPQFVQSLIDDFSTLYLAGSDTTSHGALMTIYYIYSNPQVLSSLRKEIKEQIPNLDTLSYDSFKNCHYLQATINQTMRIYSVANGIMPREAKIDHELTIGEIKIPIKKGTIVSTQTVPTHYKQTIYEDPRKFNPQRFLDKEGNLINPQPFTFMTFSAGTRSCVGRQLAVTEMKTLLTMLVSNYEVSVTEGDKKLIFDSFAANLYNVKFQIEPLKK